MPTDSAPVKSIREFSSGMLIPSKSSQPFQQIDPVAIHEEGSSFL